MEKLTLPHRLPTLAALAPTPSPLLQQRFMEKGNTTATGPGPDCSVIPGTPSPEQSGQIPGGFHERMRETTLNRQLWWARELLNPDSQYQLITLSRDERKFAEEIVTSITPRCFQGVHRRDIPFHNDAIIVSEALATGRDLLITANMRIIRDEVNEWIRRNHNAFGLKSRPLVHDADESVIALHPRQDGNLELLKTVLAASWTRTADAGPAEIERDFLEYTDILTDADLPKTAALARERWDSEARREELVASLRPHLAQRTRQAESEQTAHRTRREEDQGLSM